MAILTPPDRAIQARLRPGARVRVQVPFWLRDNEHLASAELEGTITDVRLFRKEDHSGPVGGLRSVKLDCYASVRTPNPDSQGIRRCHRCHLALTNPVSQFVGYGPDCCEAIGIDRPPQEAMPAAFLESLKDIIKTNTHRDDIWFPVPRCEWTVLEDKPVDETPATPRTGWDARFSVEGNEIVLATYPEFRHRAKLVGSWKWDRIRNVWRYPASAIKAGELREAFDGTHRVATPAFVGLLQERAVLERATAAKVADDLPPIPGLKVDGWMHQRRAYWFAEKLPAAALFMDMGCVDGEAIVTVNRAGKSFQTTLANLHYKLQGGGTVTGVPGHDNRRNVRTWDQTIPTSIRGIKPDGTLGLNRIMATMDNGVKPVVRITLRNGKTVRCTYDHEIVTPDGLVHAEDLRPGSVVLTNGGYIDKDGYVRVWGTGHPREGTGGMYEHILVAEQKLGRMLEPGEEVHHEDRNRANNHPDNLVVTDTHGAHVREHHHDQVRNFGLGISIAVQSVVESVEPDGEAHVYDVACGSDVDTPEPWLGHSFVANGILVKNTGKTLVALALIVNRAIHRTLVIAPKKVVTERTWSTNTKKFVTTPMTVVEIQPKGTVKERLERATMHMAAAGARQTVVVVNYDVIDHEDFPAWYKAANFDLCICDESHKLKSPTGVRAKVAWKIGEDIPQRMLLTGTPAAHTPLDIWSQYMILDPGIFGKSYTRFKHRYAQMGGFQGKKIEGWSNLDEWNQKVYQLAYRVGAEVLDLPPYHHIIKPCALDAKAVRAYEEMEIQMVSTFARRDPETGEVVIDRSEAANGGVKVMRLQQITSGYLRTPEGVDVRVGESKAEALACILDDLQPPRHENPDDSRSPVSEPGEPVVVFARFVHDLDVIKETALAAGFRYGEISGRAKDIELDQWKAGETDVIGVQIQAGGAGIDLTRARYAVYYSVGYSLGDYQQSLKRVHRPGQTRATTYFHLVCEGTIDDVVYGALQRNQSVVEAAMEFAAEKLKATIAEGLGEKTAV